MADRDPELHLQRSRQQFLPAESPLPMTSQQLRAFQRGEPEARTAGYMLVRRAFIFVSTAALTSAGCYEMYEVVQVGGVTVLEWMVLILFVTLFAWIAFSFSSALAGLRGAAICRPGSPRYRSRCASAVRRKQKCDAAADL